MSVPVEPLTVGRFRALVAQRLGLGFPDQKTAFLAEVLRRRAAVNRADSCDAYLEYLEAGPAVEEIDALARELTVTETYFHRHIEQYQALAGTVLPQRMRARAATRQLRFLSLGCASGEEPYTIAMVMREQVYDPSWQVSIVGADVNPVMLSRARRGRYSAWSLRATPQDSRRRWFQQEGPDMLLDPLILDSVRFQRYNAAEQDSTVWQPGDYDAIFCRNVLMYLTQSVAQEVLNRICDALAPGGFLFVGHAESLRDLSHDLELQHTHEAFYHRRRSALVPPEPRTAASEARTAVPPRPAENWVAAINGAATRVRHIVERRTPPPVALPASTVGSEWATALDLLRREHFAGAIEVVEAFPVHQYSRPDIMILHAALLTHAGQLTRAVEVCRQMLEVYPHNAGAHYLLAVCCEGSGDPDAAMRYGRAAAYLDPAFAMPPLLLGLRAGQRGDHEEARRDLSRALMLFAHEDAHRLLLFGGGFTRDALISLCRSALVASGDSS